MFLNNNFFFFLLQSDIMAKRRALSDEAVQELLHEVTLAIEGDVTVMGAEEGRPTDLDPLPRGGR